MFSVCHFLRCCQLAQMSFLSLAFAMPASAYGSPEMAIERAAARVAEAEAAGRSPDAVMVPVQEAIPAMLRPGCRLALGKPRPDDLTQVLAEDEAALSSCVNAMQSAMHWQGDSFAACPPEGIPFARAQACESAASLFLLHHAGELEQSAEGIIGLQLLRGACAPRILCP